MTENEIINSTVGFLESKARESFNPIAYPDGSDKKTKEQLYSIGGGLQLRGQNFTKEELANYLPVKAGGLGLEITPEINTTKVTNGVISRKKSIEQDIGRPLQSFMSDEEVKQTLSFAYNIATSWPKNKGIGKALRNLADAKTDKGRSNARKAFGNKMLLYINSEGVPNDVLKARRASEAKSFLSDEKIMSIAEAMNTLKLGGKIPKAQIQKILKNTRVQLLEKIRAEKLLLEKASRR